MNTHTPGNNCTPFLDRHSSATEEEKKEHEKKFKEVGEAYGVLSDSKKRSRYDHGHDLDDLDGHGFSASDIDANNVFQVRRANGICGRDGIFFFF